KRDRPGGVPAGMATGRSGRARIAIAAMALALVAVKWTAPAAAASADAHDHTALRIAYTPRVFHFTSNKDYVDWNHIVAVEYVTPRHTLWGADRSHFGLSLFDNSYGQFSQSIYYGLEWDWQPALGGQLFF